MTETRCMNCQWFMEVRDPNNRQPKGPNEIPEGECRFNPPSLVGQYHNKIANKVETMLLFPKVSGAVWCGRFKKLTQVIQPETPEAMAGS